jgi:hypothetical protein
MGQQASNGSAYWLRLCIAKLLPLWTQAVIPPVSASWFVGISVILICIVFTKKIMWHFFLYLLTTFIFAFEKISLFWYFHCTWVVENLRETSTLFPIVAMLFHLPNKSVQGFQIVQISLNIFLFLFIITTLAGVKW